MPELYLRDLGNGVLVVLDREVDIDIPADAEEATEKFIEDKFDPIKLMDEADADAGPVVIQPPGPRQQQPAEKALPSAIIETANESGGTEPNCWRVTFQNPSDKSVKFKVIREPGRDVNNNVASGKTEVSTYMWTKPDGAQSITVQVDGKSVAEAGYPQGSRS